MVDTATLLGFAAASAALIAMPGPNVAVILATGAARGRMAALTVVLGMTLAQGLQIALVVFGLAALVSAFGWTLAIIKWAGIAYLAFLGLRALTAPPPDRDAVPLSARRLFATGAITALANPKTLAFHAAFLPLFVDPARPAGPQLALLGAMFLVIAIVLDSLWALLAGSAKGVLDRYALHRAAQKASGGMMLAAAAWLALRRAN
ncbi:LysE family translocator [Marinicauda algicola]|uniref:LysE family translocator n=1 Tax=Marinicauda algicola TaxID=2029849 RepID=A0A4S2H248_9PROT|nr:LysE family translocator [Marinicauda algicola]TGY89670.1 LysE family translocator [Marinicauda algicola]